MEWVKPRLAKTLLLGVGIVAGIAAATIAGARWQVLESVRFGEDLLASPLPLPAWILATGPRPGEILPISEAVYPPERRPFGPAAGNICVQLDSALMDMSPAQLLFEARMYVDGLRVLELRPGDLLHGPFPRNGIFDVAGGGPGSQAVNYCLAMYLQPGTHLVRIMIPDNQMEYTWAFRTTPD